MADEEEINESPTPAEDEIDDEYVWPRLLAQVSQEVNSNEYVGHFTGTGWVTWDYDEGSFLSDTSRKAADRSWRRRARRRWLAIENLFPSEWHDAKVEYQITVMARRVRRAASSTTAGASGAASGQVDRSPGARRTTARRRHG